jgi:lipid II:glycine glycyltransferase (peptidoglycan interpeptide bridge formation enzyme)
MTDLRQSPKWADYLQSLGWKVEKIENVNCFFRKLPFLGLMVKIQRPEKLPLKQIEKFTQKYKTFLAKIEPKDEKQAQVLLKNGFKLSRFPLSPPKTIIIDLKKSEDQLLSQMHPKTRYNIKIAQRNGIKVEISDDFDSFSKIWLESQKRKKISFATTSQMEKFWQVFKEDSFLILAKDKKGQVLAGILMPIYDKIAYYLYAGSKKEGNKLFAPTFVTWQALKIAKEKGAKVFDFEGVYDERFKSATSSWQGFSRFKKSFGGKEVAYSGAFYKTYPNLLNFIPF